MPYEIQKRGEEWCVLAPETGKVHGCHPSRAEAAGQMRALYANVPDASGKSLHVFKDSAGDWRWFGWVSNHYRDNDTPREIISGAAHKEYVEYLDQTGDYPELWFWHIPGSKMGQADWAEFADGFLMLSGVFDKDKADIAERIATSEQPYTMSHGFRRLKFNQKSVVTDRYRMIEASPTPPGAEANPWTNFLALEDNMPISPHKKQKAIELFGPERVAEIEAGTLTLRKAAEDKGVDFKEIEDLEIPEATPTETPPAETKETKPEAIDVKALATALIGELQLESLSEMVAEIPALKEAVKGLTEQNEALKATVAALKQSDDAKIAETLAPKAVKSLAWFKEGFVASQSDKTKLDPDNPEDAKLKQAAPSALERFLTSAG